MGVIKGEIFQLAYVVEALEPALEHWTKVLGIGPFYTLPMPLPFDWLELDGRRIEGPDQEVLSAAALAQNGDVQIEILVPGRAPSPYRDFLASGRGGLQHVGIFTNDYDRQMADARAAGIGVAMEGELPLSRFSYLRTDGVFPGTMVELIEPRQPMLDLFADIRRASVDWDGSDPVRSLA